VSSVVLVAWQGMDLVESLNHVGFNGYLKQYHNTICGRHPIGVLLGVSFFYLLFVPILSVLWSCRLGDRMGIESVKTSALKPLGKLCCQRLKVKGLDIYIPPLTGKPRPAAVYNYWSGELTGNDTTGAAQVATAHCPSERTLDHAVCS